MHAPRLRPLVCPMLLLITGALGRPGAAAEPVKDVPREQRIVILVSLDGFAHFYFEDPRAHLPTLRRLAREGAVADRGMVCSFPTVTWPNHTTLVTGVPPARHGVLGNSVFDRQTGEPVQLLIDPVFDKAEIVKVPTVYDAAHAAGLKTAGVVWPATRNAKSLDWTVPDMGPQDLFEKYSSPAWLAELRSESLPIDLYGGWVKAKEGGARRDWMFTRATASLLRRHAPNLVLLHLIETDHTQHESGPKGGDALWAVNTADDRLRDLVAAIEENGLRDRTTLIVTADHGFFATDHVIHANVKLRELGLVRVEGTKVTGKDAWSVSQGGAASIYVTDRARAGEIVPRIKQAFQELEGVEAVFEPKDYGKIGQATPDQDRFGADLWVAAREGYSFSGTATGNQVISVTRPNGSHGFLPSHPGMHALFVAWGRGIKPGSRLGEIQNTEVAPTIAHLLGIELSSAEGHALAGMLERP